MKKYPTEIDFAKQIFASQLSPHRWHLATAEGYQVSLALIWFSVSKTSYNLHN